MLAIQFCITVVDGLDGSGSHRLYNQLQEHPDISTKTFLLFCFRIVSIKDSANNSPLKKPVWGIPGQLNQSFHQLPRICLKLQ